LDECELHLLVNCSLCLHPGKLPQRRKWREPSATGTTKAEVLFDVAKTVGLDPPTLSTAGELVAFWQGLLTAVGLGSYPGNPASAAELVTLLADVEWDEHCATTPHHVTLRGLLRVRDAVVALHQRREV